jgi:hypothetical protein
LIGIVQIWSLRHPPEKHLDLLPQDQIFGLQLCSRPADQSSGRYLESCNLQYNQDQGHAAQADAWRAGFTLELAMCLDRMLIFGEARLRERLIGGVRRE